MQPEQRKMPSPTYRPARRSAGPQTPPAHTPQPPNAGDQTPSPVVGKAAGVSHYSVCVITGSIRAVEALPPLTASPSASQQSSPSAPSTPQQCVSSSPAASDASSASYTDRPPSSAASCASSPSSSQVQPDVALSCLEHIAPHLHNAGQPLECLTP